MKQSTLSSNGGFPSYRLSLVRPAGRCGIGRERVRQRMAPLATGAVIRVLGAAWGDSGSQMTSLGHTAGSSLAGS